MSKEAKFAFIPEELINKRSKYRGVEYRVSLLKTRFIDKKNDNKETINYNIYFSKDVVWTYDLKGKRLKFYLDKEKKAIAWRILEGDVTLEDLHLGREVKPNQNGSWTVSVSKLMNAGEIKLEATRSSIPVKKYSADYLAGGSLYYIEI